MANKMYCFWCHEYKREPPQDKANLAWQAAQNQHLPPGKPVSCLNHVMAQESRFAQIGDEYPAELSEYLNKKHLHR